MRIICVIFMIRLGENLRILTNVRMDMNLFNSYAVDSLHHVTAVNSVCEVEETCRELWNHAGMDLRTECSRPGQRQPRGQDHRILSSSLRPVLHGHHPCWEPVMKVIRKAGLVSGQNEEQLVEYLRIWTSNKGGRWNWTEFNGQTIGSRPLHPLRTDQNISHPGLVWFC